MSCSKDYNVHLLAFNKGHNDGWEGKPHNLPCEDTQCMGNQKYKDGFHAGTTAKFYYDKGLYDARRYYKGYDDV